MIKQKDWEIKVAPDGDHALVTNKRGAMHMITALPKQGVPEQEFLTNLIGTFVAAFGLNTPDSCGAMCGYCCWYDSIERTLRDDGTWECLDPECDGTLHRTGTVWPVVDSGVHHACNKCGFTTAVRESTLLSWGEEGAYGD